MNARLIRSPYLQVIAGRDGYVAYHSLFGNMKKINRATLDFLDEFSHPRAPEEVLGRYGPEAPSNLEELQGLSYVVEEGQDERDVVREWLRQREELLPRGYFVTEVELGISDACDFKCPYCFADIADRRSEDRRKLQQNGHKIMSLETATLIIETLAGLVRANRRERLMVKFIGREPLMNRDVLVGLMDRFGSGGRCGVPIKYDLTTNCSHITDELAEKLREHSVTVNASVDIPGEGNELTRVTRTGGSSFEIADRAIGILRRHGVEVKMNSVLSDANFGDLDRRVVDYAVSRGIGTVDVFPVLCDDEMAPQRSHGSGGVADRLFDLWSYGRDRGVRLRGYWYNPVARLVATRGKDFWDTLGDRNSCVATGNQLNIEPSGDIFTCRMAGIRLGHITEIERVLESPAYRHYVMRTYAGACVGCEIEGACQGLCVGHLESKYNDIYRSDPDHCDVYRAVTRRMLEVL